MKTGYSMLLGEYVEAEKLDYRDCEHWQIVCPSCHEPLFKVKRQMPEVIDYLSHYSKDKAYVAECEARVRGLSREEMKQGNILSRDQKLQYFLNIVERMAIDSVFNGTVKEDSKLLKTLKRSKAIKEFSDSLFECRRKDKLYSEIINETFSLFESDMSKSGKSLATTFDMQFQKRIAVDFYKHILSSKSKSSFNNLICIAWVWLAQSMLLSKQGGALAGYNVDIFKVLKTAPTSSKTKGFKLITDLRFIKVADRIAEDALTVLAAELEDHLLRILLVIDYHKWLKKALAVKGPIK